MNSDQILRSSKAQLYHKCIFNLYLENNPTRTILTIKLTRSNVHLDVVCCVFLFFSFNFMIN